MEAFQSRLSEVRSGSTSAPCATGDAVPMDASNTGLKKSKVSTTQVCAIVGLLGVAIFCLAYKSRSTSSKPSASSDDPLFQPF